MRKYTARKATTKPWRRAILLHLGCVLSAGHTWAQSPVWQPQGPHPTTGGQVENIGEGEVAGAVNAVVPHPTNANTLYVGAANGGIWRTDNALAPGPDWRNLTPEHASLSIGALEMDPTDAAHQTLIAGLGRVSSFGRVGGPLDGLLRTTDGGVSWTTLNGAGSLVGCDISGVAPRGAVINVAVLTGPIEKRGLWRSENTGATFDKISGDGDSQLPLGHCWDLVGAPDDPDVLYTNAGFSGLYRSENAGAAWEKVSNDDMDVLIHSAGNIRLATAPGGIVYAGIVVGGELAGVFRSDDNGETWDSLGAPATMEAFGAKSLHPGGQGAIHFSIAADPTDTGIVYVGGDRQPRPFPNSIRANDYTGRLFRGDASAQPENRWIHLTHSSQHGLTGGGTASSSAPHADSRDMDIAADGSLIEGDDGGVYRRTQPRTNLGDWQSLNGKLLVTEFHAVAWDAVANTVIGGSQDTGTPEQRQTADGRWRSVSTGDGGVVAVDDTSVAGESTRYSSYYDLAGFRRQVFNAANVLQSQVRPALTVIGGSSTLDPQFYTPVELNAANQERLIIGASNGVYESANQGDTIRLVGIGIVANASGRDTIGYGASDNPDVLYVGAWSRVYVRTGPHPEPLSPSAYTGGVVRAVSQNPADADVAFVADPARVFRTDDAGDTWEEITGNLDALDPGELRALAVRAEAAQTTVFLGTATGVFSAAGPDFDDWSRVGLGLPKAAVYHLEYDASDQILLAGTLGRGAWTVSLADGEPPISAQPNAGTPSADTESVEP